MTLHGTSQALAVGSGAMEIGGLVASSLSKVAGAVAGIAGVLTIVTESIALYKNGKLNPDEIAEMTIGNKKKQQEFLENVNIFVIELEKMLVEKIELNYNPA